MKGRGRERARVREEYREVKRERGGNSGEGREKGGDITKEKEEI